MQAINYTYVMFFSKHFTQVSLKGRDLEVLKWTFGVVFMGRLHFTTKFFVTSISDKFHFQLRFWICLSFRIQSLIFPRLS